MARPIKPTAVRRQATGMNVEVQAASGLWTPITNLSDAAKSALWKAVRENGYSMPMPKDAFLWQFDSAREDSPVPVPIQPFEPQDEPQDDQQDGTPVPVQDDQQQDQQQRQEPQPQPGETMEDIVRRIAGHLDAVQQDGIDSRLDSMLAELEAKVKEFMPETPNNQVPLRDVVRVIELRRPDQPVLQVEGMFHKDFAMLCRVIAAGKHVFLPGEPGGGKSHHALEAIKVLNAHVERVFTETDLYHAYSLGPTTPESRLWGGRDANGNHHETGMLETCRHAMANPDMIHAVVLDEMDNGHAGILATLNSALANGWFFAPNGDKITLGKNIVFVACANTFGTGPTADFAGRNKLDPATLDRFQYLPWGTDEGLEAALVAQRLDGDMAGVWLDVWRTARANVKSHGLKHFVTMRGCINGADLLACGFTVDEALMLGLGNKLPADQWAKVNPL